MKKRFLENTPLFGVLAEEERHALAEQFVLRQFPDGTLLFKEGESAQAIFLVKSGIVRLSERHGENDRMLATFGPSSVLGEIDLLLNRPHVTSAVAQGAVDAWVLTRRSLAQVMAQHPAISLKLSSFLGERVADVDHYLIARLKKISILSELNDEALAALAASLELQEARRGALIFQAGSQAEHLYFVEHGTVTIVSTAPDDPEPFRQLGPGELFGHEALLRDRQYGAVARAASDVQLWSLSRAEFERVATAHPALRQLLSTHVSENVLAPADRNAARAVLSGVPFFAGLPGHVMDALVNRMVLRHVGTNETIYTAGDIGDALYLIDKGVIKLMDGSELVDRKEDGDYFGEIALLTGKPRPLTARAARSTNLWELSKRDFDAIAVRFPELTAAVSRILAQALARDSEEEEEADVSLSMFPLFTGLTPREQADIARRLRSMVVASGEVIFRQGAVPDAFYLVKRGQIKLTNEQGALDMVRHGGFFGEMALLTRNNHTITAQAVEDTELLVLDRNQFEVVVSRYPSVSLGLSRALSSRLEAAMPTGGDEPTRSMTVRPITGPMRALPATMSYAEYEEENPRDRSAWTFIKLGTVVLLLLWLSGVSLPMIFRAPAASVLGLDATATPMPTPFLTSTATAAPTQESLLVPVPSAPSSTPEAIAAAEELTEGSALTLQAQEASPTSSPTSSVEPSATTSSTSTVEPSATATLAPSATATLAPSSTVAPTETAVPTATEVPLPPTIPPTETPIPQPTNTLAPAPTNTPPPVASGPRNLDPRLGPLGVSIEPANVAPGQSYWRVTEIVWHDESESGGRHSIFVDVQDENGGRVVGQPLVIAWRDGSQRIVTEAKPFPEYGANFPMYAAGQSYSLYVEGLPSDRVQGMGLGDLVKRDWTVHVEYLIKYQRAVR